MIQSQFKLFILESNMTLQIKEREDEKEPAGYDEKPNMKTNTHGQDKVGETLRHVKRKAGNLTRIGRLNHHQGTSVW